jgi:hypothetical protein
MANKPINAAQLEQRKQGIAVQETPVNVAQLDALKQAQVVAEQQKAEAKIADTELQESLRLKAEFDSNNIKLDTGEYINKADFNSLPSEEQSKLKTMGIEQFNSYYNKKLIEAKGYTLLDNKETILASDYTKLTPKEQAKLNELGVEKFNVWYTEEKATQSGYTKLDTGEWISTNEFSKLSKEDQDKLSKDGVEAFNTYKNNEAIKAYNDTVEKNRPIEIKLASGSGGYKEFSAPISGLYVRTAQGDIPAWMLVPDFKNVLPVNNAPIATSYGSVLNNVRYAKDNMQEYKVEQYVNGSPLYLYKYLDSSGNTVWLNPDTFHSSLEGVLMPIGKDVQDGKYKPVLWNEDSWLGYLGINPNDAENIKKNMVGVGVNYTYSNEIVNSLFSSDSSYIDPKTGEKKTTDGFVNPYGIIDGKTGKLIQQLGRVDSTSVGGMPARTKTALQKTDIGMIGNTGSIANYVTDARTLASKSGELAQIAKVYQTSGQLPNFPLMKEVRSSIQTSSGVDLATISKYETALEPVPIKIRTGADLILDEKQNAIVRAMLDSGELSDKAIVTSFSKDDGGKDVVNYYIPQSAKEAFEQYKKEYAGTDKEVKDYQFMVSPVETDNGWVFKLGDSRTPTEIFESQIASGEIPAGSKLLTVNGSELLLNTKNSTGDYSFSYLLPLSKEALEVQKVINSKYTDFNPETKKWEPNLLKYAQDVFNETGNKEMVMQNLKLAQYDDPTIMSFTQYIPNTGMASDASFKIIASNPTALAQYIKEFPNDPRVENPVGLGMRFQTGANTYARAKLAQETSMEDMSWDKTWKAFGQYKDWVIFDGIKTISSLLPKLPSGAVKINPKIAKTMDASTVNTIESVLNSLSPKETALMPGLGIYNLVTKAIDPKASSGGSILQETADKGYNVVRNFSISERGKAVTEQFLNEITKTAKQLHPDQIKQIDENKAFATQVLVGGEQLVGGLLDLAKFKVLDSKVIVFSALTDATTGDIGKATDKILSTLTGLVFFAPDTVGNSVNSLNAGNWGEAVGNLGMLALSYVHPSAGKLPSRSFKLEDGTKAKVELNSIPSQKGVPIAKTSAMALDNAVTTVRNFLSSSVLKVPVKMFDNVTGATYTVYPSNWKSGKIDAKYTIEYTRPSGATKEELNATVAKLDSKVDAELSKNGILKEEIVVQGDGVKAAVKPMVVTSDITATRLQKTAADLKTAEANLVSLTNKFSNTKLDYVGKTPVSIGKIEVLATQLKGEYLSKFSEAMKNIELKEPIAYTEFESKLKNFMDSSTRKEIMRILKEDVPSDYAKLASDLQYAQYEYLKLLDRFKDEFSNLTGELTIEELEKIAELSGRQELIQIIKMQQEVLRRQEEIKALMPKEVTALYEKENYVYPPDITKVKVEQVEQLGLFEKPAVEGKVETVAEVSKVADAVKAEIPTETVSKIIRNANDTLRDSIMLADGEVEIKIRTTDNGKYAIGAEIVSHTNKPILVNGYQLIGDLTFGDKITVGDKLINWVPVDLYMPPNTPFDIQIRAEGTKQWLENNLDKLNSDREGVVKEVGRQLGLNIIDLNNATVKELGFFLGNLVGGSAKDIPAGIKNIVVGHAEELGGGKLRDKTLQQFINENIKSGEDVLAVVCDKDTARYMGKAEGKIIKSNEVVREKTITGPSAQKVGGEKADIELVATSKQKNLAIVQDKPRYRKLASELGLKTEILSIVGGKALDFESGRWLPRMEGHLLIFKDSADGLVALNKYKETYRAYKNGEISLADYHRGLGEALGYSKESIESFIKPEDKGKFENKEEVKIPTEEKVETGIPEPTARLDFKGREEIPVADIATFSRTTSITPSGKLTLGTELKIEKGQLNNVKVWDKDGVSRGIVSGMQLRYGDVVKIGDTVIKFIPNEASPAYTLLAREYRRSVEDNKVDESVFPTDERVGQVNDIIDTLKNEGYALGTKELNTETLNRFRGKGEKVIEQPIVEKPKEIVIEETKTETEALPIFEVGKIPVTKVSVEKVIGKQKEFKSKLAELEQTREQLGKLEEQLQGVFEPKVSVGGQRPRQLRAIIIDDIPITELTSKKSLQKLENTIRKQQVQETLGSLGIESTKKPLNYESVKDVITWYSNKLTSINKEIKSNETVLKVKGLISENQKKELVQETADLRKYSESIKQQIKIINDTANRGEEPIVIVEKGQGTQIKFSVKEGPEIKPGGESPDAIWKQRGSTTERRKGVKVEVAEKTEQSKQFGIEKETVPTKEYKTEGGQEVSKVKFPKVLPEDRLVEQGKTALKTEDVVKIKEAFDALREETRYYQANKQSSDMRIRRIAERNYDMYSKLKDKLAEIAKDKIEKIEKSEGKIKITNLEKEKLDKLANDIAKGKKEFTDDERQLQTNYPKELEALLNELKKAKEPISNEERIKRNDRIEKVKEELNAIELAKSGDYQVTDTRNRFSYPYVLPTISKKGQVSISEYPQIKGKEITGARELTVTQPKGRVVTSLKSIAAVSPETKVKGMAKEQTGLEQQIRTQTAVKAKGQVEAQAKVKTQSLPKEQVKLKTKTAVTTKVTTKVPVKRPITKIITKKGKKIITLPEDKIKELTNEQLKSMLAYKQGFIYIVRYDPYKKTDVIYSRKPLQGVKYYKGIGSAQKSVVLKRGVILKDLVFDQGAVDLMIGKTEQGKTPKMRYFKDKQYGKSKYKSKYKQSLSRIK